MNFKRILKSIIILVITTLSCISCKNAKTTETNNPVVIGYLTSHRVNALDSGHYNRLTHVIYKKIKPLADGGLLINKRIIEDIKTIKNQIKGKNIKLIAGFGGGEISGYSEFMDQLTQNKTARENLAKNLKAFCVNNKIDGVDINWEHPKTNLQRDNLALAMRQIAKEFEGTELLLTAAFNSSSKCGLETAKRLAPYIDFVNIMTYDIYESNIHATVNHYTRVIESYIEAGIDKAKIVPGLPFYGKEVDKMSDGKPGRSAVVYRKIIELKPEMPEDVNIVDVTKVVNGRSSDIKYAFDSVDKIRAKTKIALELGVAGVMIWEVGHDVKSTSTKSLLWAIQNEISKASSK